jgi:hypothetical protein
MILLVTEQLDDNFSKIDVLDGGLNNQSFITSENDFEDVRETLQSIWHGLSNSNLRTIVLIVLMSILIILFLILIGWTFLFMGNYDPSANSLFYRKLSSMKQNSNDDVKRSIATYGATNQAFDPTPSQRRTSLIELELQNPKRNVNSAEGPGNWDRLLICMS